MEELGPDNKGGVDTWIMRMGGCRSIVGRIEVNVVAEYHYHKQEEN